MIETKHTVGENQHLYDMLGIKSGEHTVVTEKLCEIIWNMMNCHNCGNTFGCNQECSVLLRNKEYDMKWIPK